MLHSPAQGSHADSVSCCINLSHVMPLGNLAQATHTRNDYIQLLQANGSSLGFDLTVKWSQLFHETLQDRKLCLHLLSAVACKWCSNWGIASLLHLHSKMLGYAVVLAQKGSPNLT